jgi:hypothetical protein
MADVRISEVDLNVHQSSWDHEMLYADSSSKDKQRLTRLFFVKNQKYEIGGRFNVNIHVLFHRGNS